MMSSSRSVNISLTAGAHFYLAFQGSAWTALDDPAVSGLYWSIVTFINLRLRPDGFINTPPEATVVSPQYAIVNQTTQINIPVSDVNPGDDVRCRWSMMIPGQRKRRLAHEYERFHSDFTANHYRKLTTSGETAHIRNKRKPNGGITPNPCTTKLCSKSCKGTCPCVCPSCSGTTCTGVTCNQPPKSSCPTGTTTAETPGTIPMTSSYPSVQPIDECGGICYPSSVPSGTTLSNCTLSFMGLVPDTWYAVSIQ
ncbi:unnamed protein product, partial [Rotaria magnacalcarata]